MTAFCIALAGCSASEQPRPEPDGIVVLEVPSATSSTRASAESRVTVAAKEDPLDVESCIQKLRQDPFPGGPADPSGGGLYLAGLAAETRGDTTLARKGYFDLVQRFPAAPYVPLAYFGFGELFRAELATDRTKLQFAVQAYDEALKHPEALNPIFQIALLRRAEVHAMSGEDAQVIASLLRIAQASTTGPCRDALKRRIEEMLPPAYAVAGSPAKAARFFALLGHHEFAASTTARLARLYISQKKTKDALAALLGLANSDLTPGPALCSDALAVAQELADPGLLRDLGAKCKR